MSEDESARDTPDLGTAPRQSLPPDGYLGFRNEHEPNAEGWGCGALIVAAVITLGIIYALLWWIGLYFRSKGI